MRVRREEEERKRRTMRVSKGQEIGGEDEEKDKDEG